MKKGMYDKIDLILASISGYDNKISTISLFSVSTAICNAVLLIKKIFYKISFTKKLIRNFIKQQI